MSRCLNFLIAKGLAVEELITDASSSVAKILGSYNVYLHCMHVHNVLNIHLSFIKFAQNMNSLLVVQSY